jgi:outer membrane protein OmpA-like peptidoglycan-associated protein
LTAIWTDILSNTALEGSGGAFYVNSTGKVSIDFGITNIVGNQSFINGGAIYIGNATDASFKFDDLVIKDNKAAAGGAIYYSGDSISSFTAINTSIVGNIAEQSGGGIFISVKNSGALDFGITTISNNTAGIDGGAIFLTGGNIQMTDPLIVGNSAVSGRGGAIYLSNGTLKIISKNKNVLIYGNTANNIPNSVYVDNGSILVFEANKNILIGDGIASDTRSSIYKTGQANLYITSVSYMGDYKGSLFVKNGRVYTGGDIYFKDLHIDENAGYGSFESKGSLKTRVSSSVVINGILDVNINVVTKYADEIIMLSGAEKVILSSTSKIELRYVHDDVIAAMDVILINGATIGTFSNSSGYVGNLLYNTYYNEAKEAVFLHVESHSDLTGISHNAQESARFLNSATRTNYNNESLMKLINDIWQITDSQDQQMAMNELHGAFYGTLFLDASESKARPFVFREINKEFSSSDNKNESRHDIWVQAGYIKDTFNADENTLSRYSSENKIGVLGFDVLRLEDIIVGLYGSYLETASKQKLDLAYGNEYEGGLYSFIKLFKNPSRVNMRAMVSYARRDYSVQRTLDFTSSFDGLYKPESAFSLRIFRAALELERIFEIFDVTGLFLRPYIGLNGAVVQNDMLTEHEGGVSNLEIYGGTNHYILGVFGLNTDIPLIQNSLLLRVGIGGKTVLTGDKTVFRSRLAAGANYEMEIYGVEEIIIGEANVGIAWDITRFLSFYANAGGAMGKKHESISMSAGLRLKFPLKTKEIEVDKIGTYDVFISSVADIDNNSISPSTIDLATIGLFEGSSAYVLVYSGRVFVFPSFISASTFIRELESKGEYVDIDDVQATKYQNGSIVIPQASTSAANNLPSQNTIIKSITSQNDSEKISLGEQYFSSNEISLTVLAKEQLAQQLFNTIDPNSEITIEGHTDSTGSNEINIRISRQRAEAVRAELIKQGFNEKNIQVIGRGSSMPIADNKTQEGRRQNRRAEIFVVRN